MAQYRFLAPHSIGQFYFEAGDIASTADVGGTLPTNWQPSNAVEPLDVARLRGQRLSREGRRGCSEGSHQSSFAT
jgi:hypothetical protein